ncbi:unnamed protein product, partial [Staurois parvus]
MMSGSDILFTNVPVITDWPIRDYMNCDLTQRSLLAAIGKYCESCDWSQLVTWYKAVVNSLVPCDLCDHSQ